MDSKFNLIKTDRLQIAYESYGEGEPVLLLHGWPDDASTWDIVVSKLVKENFRIIVPWLRGSGESKFRDGSVMRCGQVVAFASDVIDLIDALGLKQVTFVGHDWGARTGYAVAALWPDRIKRLIVLAAGYETGIKPGEKIKPEQAHAYWYQWFWHTERGREMLEKNRDGVCQYLWKTWSPNLQFTNADFEKSAHAWKNPDWVEVTLHSYRVRWGGAPRDLSYEELETKLSKHPKIQCPTLVLHGEQDGASLVESSANQESSFTAKYERRTLPGVGHFIQREVPQFVVEAIQSFEKERTQQKL